MSDDELELLARLDAGETIVVNLSRHRQLVALLRQDGRLVRIGRPSQWGNPFRIGRDGSRDTVIQRYRDEHLPTLTAEQLRRLPALRGMALACWCAPAPCHGDVLAELAERSAA